MTTRETPASEPPALGKGLEIDRRTLLLGATALALPQPAFARPASLQAQAIRFVVADPRHPESLSFAAALSRGGAATLELGSGLTSLWQQKLAPHWRGSTGAVAGLTTRAIWDCLSEQAQMQFRKPRLIGRHALDAKRAVLSHRLAPPNALPLAIDPHRVRGRDWPAEIAGLIERCAAITAPCGAEHHIGPARPGAELSQSLVSWIIV